jgi:hypothetical protein
MARHKSSATKPGERIQAVIKVIFDPETRLFGYYNPETDSSAPSGELLLGCKWA